MAKSTRIYTRTGDDGTTGLVGGQRVRKDAGRIEAYGTIDELSSAIGLARTALGDIVRDATATPVAKDRSAALDAWLAWVQDALFNLGSDLATLPEDRWPGMPLIAAADAQALERAIDVAERDLEPLNTFILPGGSYPAAFLNVARTISRRAERLLVTMSAYEAVSPEVMQFVNRLSDALFVWARWINAGVDGPEARWNKHSAPPGTGETAR